MKNNLLLIVLLCALTLGIQAQQQSQVFYWVSDKTGKTDNFLYKYDPVNHDDCKHYLARIDGISLQRGASVAFKTDTKNFQGFKAYYDGGGDAIMGMNSGLMNKSYEYADRTKWSNKFSGDLGIITKAKAAGATKVVMFMQSPLSKGKGDDFKPGVISTKNPNGGATISMRVDDCFEYAEYIWANKPGGIEVTFGLIDAFPAKDPQPADSFHNGYVKLAKGLQDRGMFLEEIQFDMKTLSVRNAATNKLLNAMERAYNEIKASTGTEVRMSWYTWWGSKQATTGEINAALVKAFENIANHPKSKYMTGLLLDGNDEQRGGIVDLIPDDINTKRTITARVNEAFSVLEKLDGMNPVKAGDPILGSNVITSISEFEDDLELLIYPNPVIEYLTIQRDNTAISNIRIFNISGKTVYKSTLRSVEKQIDLSHLSKGMYIMELSNDNTRIIKKIIKN
ncbi:MAG: T9SS type A sorting domain-containing protein [Bacteroidales bacterium]|nr:T9SS type A sorting domain-containing protein [Bacteroidales bacterium]